MVCPLCGSRELEPRGTAFGRRLRACPRCRLLSVHPDDHPSNEAAARRYRLHRNSPNDPDYRAFLARLLEPVLPRLAPGARGLDYGCGPTPLLAAMAQAAGLACDAFDPVFHPTALQPPYDFVLASEVFEHFREPAVEIPRTVALLAPARSDRAGGLLAVMTLYWSDAEDPGRSREGNDLSRWHYLSDPTHVSIYREETFAWIAGHHGLRVEWSDGERVVLLRKTAVTGG